MNLHPRRLAELPLFKTVPEADLAELCVHLQGLTLPRGAVLYTQGEPARDAVLVVHGRVTVTVADGRAVGDSWAGDILGEAGLFGALRTATVTAATDTDLAVITVDAVSSLPYNRGIIAIEQKLLGSMTKRFRAANARLEMADRAAQERRAGKASRAEPPTRPQPDGGLIAALRRMFGGVA
jgi:CRP-like cAMP-binding protein